MKIIHTSDWHLGHKLYGFDRHQEQQSFLQQLTKIVKEEQPDALVVSGDIFHTSAPSSEVQTMFVDSLLAIAEAYPELVMVITAGNHDSYARLEIDKNLWALHHVYIIGNVVQKEDKTADYAAHIIAIPNKGFIAAVPHCYEQNFPAVSTSKETSRMSAFFEGLGEELQKMNKQQLPVVMMAHLTVAGCDLLGHDVNIGGMDSVDLTRLGKAYDYLALGHIHRPQFIEGSSHRVRYSGTPLPITFDETFKHTVTVVEMEKHGDVPQCREKEIVNPRPLVNVPEKEEAVDFESAVALLRSFDPDTPAYIRLNVLTENGYLPADCYEQALAATDGKKCNFCFINRLITEKNDSTEEKPQIFIDQLQNMSHHDIIHIASLVMSLDEEQKKMLQEAIRFAEENSQK